MGADPAFVASRSSPQAVLTKGFNPGASDLLERIEKLLHPQRGLCRGLILNKDKPHDKPEDPFPTTIRELLEVRSVLSDCADALRQQEQSQ